MSVLCIRNYIKYINKIQLLVTNTPHYTKIMHFKTIQSSLLGVPERYKDLGRGLDHFGSGNSHLDEQSGK